VAIASPCRPGVTFDARAILHGQISDRKHNQRTTRNVYGMGAGATVDTPALRPPFEAGMTIS
jgi:hypothetical protein